MYGAARRASTTRMTASSVRPPRNPSRMPSVPPHVTAISVAVRVMARAIRPPRSTRVKTSRPNWSVPKKCSPEGLKFFREALISVGSKGTIKGDDKAMRIWKTKIVSPSMPDFDWRRYSQVSASRPRRRIAAGLSEVGATTVMESLLGVYAVRRVRKRGLSIRVNTSAARLTTTYTPAVARAIPCTTGMSRVWIASSRSVPKPG